MRYTNHDYVTIFTNGSHVNLACDLIVCVLSTMNIPTTLVVLLLQYYTYVI